MQLGHEREYRRQVQALSIHLPLVSRSVEKHTSVYKDWADALTT